MSEPMQAGPELDALIAEKVMGLVPGVDFGQWPEHDWKREKDGTVDDLAYDGDYHNGPQCKRCGFSYCQHCERDYDPEKPETIPELCKVEPLRYSTMIQWAWLVAAKLRLAVIPWDGSYFAGQYDEERDYFDTKMGVIDGHFFKDGYAVAETAPLAICRAAMGIDTD